MNSSLERQSKLVLAFSPTSGCIHVIYLKFCCRSFHLPLAEQILTKFWLNKSQLLAKEIWKCMRDSPRSLGKKVDLFPEMGDKVNLLDCLYHIVYETRSLSSIHQINNACNSCYNCTSRLFYCMRLI